MNITVATQTTTIDAQEAIRAMGTGTLEPNMPVLLEHGSVPVGKYLWAMQQRTNLLYELAIAHSKAIGQLADMHPYIMTTEHSMLIDWLCAARNELNALIQQMDAV